MKVNGDVSGACALKGVHNFMLLQSWGEHWRVGWWRAKNIESVTQYCGFVVLGSVERVSGRMGW